MAVQEAAAPSAQASGERGRFAGGPFGEAGRSEGDGERGERAAAAARGWGGGRRAEPAGEHGRGRRGQRGAMCRRLLTPRDYAEFRTNVNEQSRQYAVTAALAPFKFPVVVGVIAFGLLNPDPAYAPNFDTVPEDRPSALERLAEIGVPVALGAAITGAGTTTKGGVYILRDEAGNVVRTGRTNDLARRAGEHGRAAETARLEFDVVERTDNRAVQRGLEQIIHEQFKPPLDKINPISPTNRGRQGYLDAARRFLRGEQ